MQRIMSCLVFQCASAIIIAICIKENGVLKELKCVASPPVLAQRSLLVSAR